MKKILISCSTHDAGNYIRILQNLNIQPVLNDEIVKVQDFDGLLLPGGGDIAPLFYHQKNYGSRNICITEDIIQLLMFHRFYEQKKPILGICKGMQLMNVALGGNLYQSLQAEDLHAWHNQDRYHKTTLLPGSILHSLYGKNIVINSAHHQAIQTLGENLIATQYAFDGTIEGIEHNSLPILGVQWHPERLCSSDHSNNCACGIPLFKWFASKL